MTLAQALEVFASRYAIAKALDIKPSSVYAWKAIPLVRQYELAELSGGRLQVDRRLRPASTPSVVDAVPLSATHMLPITPRRAVHIEERHAASSAVTPSASTEDEAQIQAALAELTPSEREAMRKRIAAASSVGVAQTAEPRDVAPVVVGSNPTPHPKVRARRIEPWELSDRGIMAKALELRIEIPNGSTYHEIRQLCVAHLARG